MNRTTSDTATTTAATALAANSQHWQTFLQKIGAVYGDSSNSNSVSSDVNDRHASSNVTSSNAALMDMFTQFFQRNNLSTAAVEQVFNNESYSMEELMRSRTVATAQPSAAVSTTHIESLSFPTTTSTTDPLDAIRMLFAMSNPKRTLVQIAYLTLVSVACFGNCAVIITYSVAKHWRHEISVFHIQLAIADMLLALVCIPFTMQQVLHHFWPWPPALCAPILCMQLFSVCMSIFTLVCIGIDRLQFVWYPLRQRLSYGTSGKLTMLFVAVVAGGFSLAQLPFIVVERQSPMSTTITSQSSRYASLVLYQCKMKVDESNVLGNIAVYMITLTYILPLLFLMFVYACIGRAVWTRQPPGERLSHAAREPRALAEKRQIIKSLILIVALFALAWLPLNALVIIFTLIPNAIIAPQQTYNTMSAQSALIARMRSIYLPCHFIAMTSTCINPAVYAFMHTTFRTDFRRICAEVAYGVRCRFGCLAPLSDSISNSSGSIKGRLGNNNHRNFRQSYQYQHRSSSSAAAAAAAALRGGSGAENGLFLTEQTRTSTTPSPDVCSMRLLKQRRRSLSAADVDLSENNNNSNGNIIKQHVSSQASLPTVMFTSSSPLPIVKKDSFVVHLDAETGIQRRAMIL